MSTITTPSPAARSTAPSRQRPHAAAVARVEVRDEVLALVREPTALFFSVAMPVAFFALFAGMFGGEPTEPGGVPVGTAMLATFGAFGVIGSGLMPPGIGLAESRERGWLQAMRVSPVPVPVTLGAKLVATVPYSLGILVAMTATTAALGVLELTVLQWLQLAGTLVLGSLPFALVGIAVGSHASGNATTAILNAVLIPSSIASGLWFPLDTLPGWVGSLAVWLPPYHLAQLAHGAVGPTSTSASVHLAALLGFTAVAFAVAVVAYRRAPS